MKQTGRMSQGGPKCVLAGLNMFGPMTCAVPA
jgi:hypothetical protein